MKAYDAGVRRGFTLIEMLAVTVIIGILVSLISVAVLSALETARETRITVEVGQLDTAFRTFQAKYSRFPPADLRNPDDSGSPVYRFMQAVFPRYDLTQLEADLTTAIPAYDPEEFDPAKALVFWLRGFSPDPTRPITGTGTRAGAFEFDPNRIEDGRYMAAGTPNISRAYLYIDAGSYTQTYQGFQAYPGANPSSFQIISSGLDGNYGGGGLTYPFAATVTGNDADNITNFSGGKTLSDISEQQ